jgi:hypothetical protein
MTQKKTKRASRVKKGARYGCDECGLVVTVSEPCGCFEAHDLLCCGAPMKPKRKTARRKK